MELSEYTDSMSLWALHTNAELHGGKVDMSKVGPVMRGQCAAYLRGLADRILLSPPSESNEPPIASDVSDMASAEEVASVMDTSLAGLAQMRFRGTGPRFVKRGRRVLYRWSDVRAYLDANTHEGTGATSGNGAL